MKHISLCLFISILGISCSGTDQNNLESIDKKSAREVVLRTVIEGDTILHISNQTIWANNTIIATRTDTIKTPLKAPVWGENPTNDNVDMQKPPIYVTVE